MSSSKRKTRVEMSDSDDYHSNKVYKEHRPKKHKARHHESNTENKNTKKSSRRDVSLEDSGQESDSRGEFKSSNSHEKIGVRDEKVSKQKEHRTREQRNYDSDEHVAKHKKKSSNESDENSSNDLRSKNKIDGSKNSEKGKEKHRVKENEVRQEKRKDKHRDKENEVQQEKRKDKHRDKENELQQEKRKDKHRDKENEHQQEKGKDKHRDKLNEDRYEKRKDRSGDQENEDRLEKRKDKHRDQENEDRLEKRKDKHRDQENEDRLEKRKDKHRDQENEDRLEKRKDKHRDQENEDRQEKRKNKRKDQENEDRQEKRKDKHRKQENEVRLDKRKDKYRDQENKGRHENIDSFEAMYTESDRRKDYNEKENEYDEYLSSRQKRKHRSSSDDELPVSRQKNKHNNTMNKSNQDFAEDYGEGPESVSFVVQKEDPKKVDDIEPLSKRQKIENINIRTGGAYIPPARLRMMQEKIQDKGSIEYQRIAWEALKKSIVGMTNKVNSSNIGEIVPELFKENIIRGRGVLARAIMQAQAASPTFTRVYAALVAIINTKFPEIGELILKRLIVQYKRGFRRNDKTVCMTAARFIAHLLNQEVAHEVLILEIVTHLLENPSEDSVEVAIATLKECGKKLTELTARGMRAITQRVRDVLHEGKVDVRVRYMIEVFFAVQKDGFKDFEIIPQELDLIEEEDKYTHLINLDDAVDGQEMLNVFKFDPDYLENEEKYKAVAKEILEGGSDSENSGDESDDEEEEGDEETKDDESQQIIDMTETNIVCLRRKIYLTIQSSLDFEECAHKLLRLELKPGQILEMCYMILDCCAQQRTYEKFFGLLAQRFCQLSKVYVEPFTEIFENSYKTIHRLETNKLRNVAKFFAHLLYTDAISWMVLANIKLNEEDTTSSSRIFIKILFQELCEYMGLSKLNDRVKDITLQEAFDGLFPRDHPHNTRFAINFFTSIGLGGLTDELREHLKNLPKNPVPVESKVESSAKESSESSSSSSNSSSSSSTSSSSDSSSSDSDDRHSKQRKRKQATKRK